MIKMLTRDDLREFFAVFAAAIELDQIRADALPPEKFHPEYSDGMWRRWRRAHLEYFNQMLSTVDAVPLALLEKLTWIATNYEPAVVEKVELDLFSQVASGDPTDIETAALFINWLIKELFAKPEAKQIAGNARTLMMQWLSVADPLHISEDPECGYIVPSGFRELSTEEPTQKDMGKS